MSIPEDRSARLQSIFDRLRSDADAPDGRDEVGSSGGDQDDSPMPAASDGRPLGADSLDSGAQTASHGQPDPGGPDAEHAAPDTAMDGSSDPGEPVGTGAGRMTAAGAGFTGAAETDRVVADAVLNAAAGAEMSPGAEAGDGSVADAAVSTGATLVDPVATGAEAAGGADAERGDQTEGGAASAGDVSDAGIDHIDRTAVIDDAEPDDAATRDEAVGSPGSAASEERAPHPVGSTGDEPAVVRPRRPLPRILAVANQKGGVGKTTTAVNLSAALAELGYRVLVVDLDPQGNASTGLGVNARTLEATVYDVLMRDLPLEDAIEPTSVKNLFVVPATIDLAGAEIELVPAFSRELKLKRALESVGDDFDFTVIDCPPSLGLLTVNALAAAGEVVVPIQCEYYALEGLSQLLRNVQLVRGNLNPTLEMSTIILTMYDSRTKLAEQVAREVREHFGPVVCRQRVPRSVRLSEAPSFGQPITTFDPSSRGAIAYRELAKEVSGGPSQRLG